MSVTFLAGATSQSVDVFLKDSSSTVGAGLAGLVYNTASLTAYYRIGATGTATAITLATQTVGGAWSSGGFVEIDATNTKGLYRLDIPDAVLASAALVTIYIQGAANLAPTPLRIDCRPVPKVTLADTLTTYTGNTKQTGDTYALANGATGFAAIAGYIDTEVGTLLSDLAAVLVDSGTTLDGKLDAIKAVTDVLPDAGALTSLATAAGLTTVETVVDAIRVVTDQMVFTTVNQLDVQVISMATDSMTADAAATDFIGAAEIAAGAASEIADLIAADWIASDASPLAIVAALKADAEWSNLAAMQTAIDNLNDISVADLLTAVMTESYAADGAEPTLTQALYLILQRATEFAIAGTSITVKKLDGTTTAAVLTMDDATSPTSSTRSS